MSQGAELRVFDTAINVGNFSSLADKMKKFARVCERLGVPAPSMSVVGKPFLEPRVRKDGSSFLVEMQLVHVEAYTPVLSGGFRLVAVVTPMAVGTSLKPIVTRVMQTPFEISEDIDPTACDYCKARRRRNHTFVIWSQEKNEIRQVGGECLKDFLGHSPADMLAFSSSMEDIESEFSGEQSLLEPQADGDQIYLLAFLIIVAESSDSYGFVTRSEAEESQFDAKRRSVFPKVATSERAIETLIHQKKSRKSDPVVERYRQEALDAIAWAKALPGSSEFERNLRTIASASHFPVKFAGIAAYIYGGWAKQKAKLQKTSMLKPVEQRGYVGTLEDRTVFKGTLISEKEYQGDYGATYYHTISVDGNLVAYKGSKSISKAAKVLDDEGLRQYLDLEGEFAGQMGSVRRATLEKEGFEWFWDRKEKRTIYLKRLSPGDTFFFLASVEKHEVYTPQFGKDQTPTPRTQVKRLVVLGDIRGEEAYGAPVGDVPAATKKKLDPATRAELDAYLKEQAELADHQAQRIAELKAGCAIPTESLSDLSHELQSEESSSPSVVEVDLSAGGHESEPPHPEPEQSVSWSLEDALAGDADLLARLRAADLHEQADDLAVAGVEQFVASQTGRTVLFVLAPEDASLMAKLREARMHVEATQLLEAMLGDYLAGAAS